jgi:CRISPR-associated protein Cas2
MRREEKIDVLVCYDVDTTQVAGQARLRKISKACVQYGQRVQYSVFECRLTLAKLQQMKYKVLDIADLKKDSVRIYYLQGPREAFLEAYGRDWHVDFDGPLIF